LLILLLTWDFALGPLITLAGSQRERAFPGPAVNVPLITLEGSQQPAQTSGSAVVTLPLITLEGSQQLVLVRDDRGPRRSSPWRDRNSSQAPSPRAPPASRSSPSRDRTIRSQEDA